MCLFMLVGATLSLVSSLALLASWCLIPRWRSLLNFVSLNQIVIGTLHQFCLIVLNYAPGKTLLDTLILLNDYLFLASLCWSLCASMVTYLKLVLAYPGKMSCEKRKATMFTYGALLITKSVTDCFVAGAFHLSELSQVLPVKFVLMYVIMAVNLFVFVKVTVHVRWRRAVRAPARARSPAAALVGAGFVCDALTTITMSAVLIGFYTRRYEFLFWIQLFFFRLVPQAAVVLFNERSRNVWCKYLERRRNIRSNALGAPGR